MLEITDVRRRRRLIVAIKSLHSVIFVLMSAAVLHVIYSGVTGVRGTLLWLSIGLLTLEGVVLFANRVRCPLTTMAQRLGDATGDDYLSEWLLRRSGTRSIVPVCGGTFALGLLLIIVQTLLAPVAVGP